jgi:hypothetical protein
MVSDACSDGVLAALADDHMISIWDAQDSGCV